MPCQVYLSVLSVCHALTTSGTVDCTPVEDLLCVEVGGGGGRALTNPDLNDILYFPNLGVLN